jgi:predicted nucleic acid-binding protein
MAKQVIDASVAVKWLIDGESFCEIARKLLVDSKLKNIELIGPPILLYEVESILQMRLNRSIAPKYVVDEALATFYDIGVKIETDDDMVIDAREIARRFKQNRIYDSLYAALAQIRKCDFWTADESFYNAVKSDLSFVRHLPDYI